MAVNTRPIILLFIFFFIIFFHEQTLPQVEHMTKENSQFERTTKNPQKPKYFSGSIHHQTFPQVDHTNKNLLRGTNNSKMLIGGNTAGRETHEPTTRKRCATNKLKISGKRGPSRMMKAVIDLFGIVINQDFFFSLVDVNKENDNREIKIHVYGIRQTSV